MKHLSKCVLSLVGVTVLVLLTTPVLADWDPGDLYKMHFPQLPDPNGWDLEIFSGNMVADDWQCSQSGKVEDIHFWTSWANDNGYEGVDPNVVPGWLDYVNITIYADVPAGIDAPYSHPGQELWNRNFRAELLDFTVRPYGTGDQGFADPHYSYTPNDHLLFQQINIAEIENPFVQVEGQIYWLGITAGWDTGVQAPVGWKTSQNHAFDAAVFNWSGSPTGWVPLDPIYGNVFPNEPPPYRFDMAFVITPEPSTFVLLGIAALSMLAYAWQRRK